MIMTAAVDEFLAGYGVTGALQHKKGDGRKFDESKVKRDGTGQFASKASAKRPDDDFRSPEQMDAEFLANIDDNKALNAAANKAKLYETSVNILKDIRKASGLSVKQLMSFDKPDAPPAAVKAMTQYFTKIASYYNGFLSKSPAAISPSGKQRVQIRITNPGTPKMELTEVLVPNNIKHDGMTVDSFLAAVLDHNSLTHAAGWRKVMELFGIDLDKMSDDFDDSNDENDED